MAKIPAPIGNDFCPQTLFLYGTYKKDGTPNFGLFCWISYCCWGSEIGVMACIGLDKLTKDRIRETGCFPPISSPRTCCRSQIIAAATMDIRQTKRVSSPLVRPGTCCTFRH